MSVKRKHSESSKSTSKMPSPNNDDFASFDPESDAESTDSDTEMSAETRAELLKGFDSDSDSEEEKDVAEDDRIIELSNLTPSINSALSKKKLKGEPESGVLYIGRIPHGFYEEEMTSYFSQFGTISNLRMSRSKKTGRSRHYAFIEFADRDVAEIVAQTMHNYLLAAHLLQVILLTPEEFKKKGGRDLFKGAGKKFKALPWAQIAKDRVESAKTKQQWNEIEKREQKRRIKQNEKIKAAGIEYEYESASKKIKASETQHQVKSKKEAAGSSKGAATRSVKDKRTSSTNRKASSSGSRKVSVK